MISGHILRTGIFAAAALLGAGAAFAQSQDQNPGAAFTGLSANSNDPIQIEADSLEIQDAKKLAIYRGNVRVRQGESLMKTPEMQVFYTGSVGGGAGGNSGGGTNAANTGTASNGAASKSAGANGGGAAASGVAGAPGSSIERIEATGPVVVQSQDQTATGDHATFVMATDMVTMTGNVVLTQNGNVVRGNRLTVNLKTKEAHVQGGRVQTILAPSSNQGKRGAPAAKKR
ncbi:lipopolysaccharide export system protein LptA [Faunimonas pinastri]|uniref:Lipopolysaccharide export system protein LptA n=1 Tax=Faunimonas pinastri TaxID=1855383 RepID=A0A1H9IU11_9HYPH|nr:LptA/OstA family protein [Faunimonas pinastri]SEQ78064.1 lipopolysaccharide export system protein LptA [Faunimonas pinastri]